MSRITLSVTPGMANALGCRERNMRPGLGFEPRLSVLHHFRVATPPPGQTVAGVRAAETPLLRGV